MKSIRRLLFIVFAALALAGNLSCSDKGGYDPLPSEGDDDEVPGTSEDMPLALTISTTYFNTETPHFAVFEETGTSVCAVTEDDPVVTCSIVVPEARLYYSKMSLLFSRSRAQCKLLVFKPYYYLASVSATYTPPGQISEVDCTADPLPIGCYGGAAPDIVPDFPTYTQLIYFPDEGSTSSILSASVDISSAYSTSALSNRKTANDLDLGKRGADIDAADLGDAGDGYIEDSFVDYEFECKDDWYDDTTYRIRLNVTDEDSEAGAVNDRFTWREAP